MNFYQNPAPTPFVTVGNTGLHQPQLQQSIKSHLSQEQYIAELENRLRALWDKYEGDRNHYMDRIKRLEEELERTKQDRNAIAKKTREPLLLKLDRAADRIKRLEEAGDALANTQTYDLLETVNWRKSKEAKP